MLKVEGINQYYGGSHILRNLGFEAKLGEVTVVLGRNGVGKTTLLKSLMGVVPVKTGSIKLDGADITRDPPYERVRQGVGYVPQGREIFGRLTVEENLRMGLAYKKGGTPIPAELFELFPVLKQMINRRGGERPRDRELLLLAAGQVAAAAVQHLLEHREQLEQFLRDGGAARLGGQPHAQVLLHREAGEDLAALRHEADTRAGALVRRGGVDGLAVEFDAAGLDRHQAHQ